MGLPPDQKYIQTNKQTDIESDKLQSGKDPMFSTLVKNGPSPIPLNFFNLYFPLTFPITMSAMQVTKGLYLVNEKSVLP